MAFWTYILHCRSGKFYTGHTDNLERRIAEHESGLLPGFTGDHLPVKLVWSQNFATRYEALCAERQIKGWGRPKKMVLIRGDWDLISKLAKSKTPRPIEETDRTSPLPQTVRPEPVEGPSFLDGEGENRISIPAPVRAEPVVAKGGAEPQPPYCFLPPPEKKQNSPSTSSGRTDV